MSRRITLTRRKFDFDFDFDFDEKIPGVIVLKVSVERVSRPVPAGNRQRGAFGQVERPLYKSKGVPRSSLSIKEVSRAWDNS